MEIGARAVEQPDDRRVDMPRFIWFRRSDAGRRLRRMHALTRSPPAMSPNESMPGGCRCEDLAESLCKDGECTRRDVPVLVRRDHVLDRADLVECELMGHSLRAARRIIERAFTIGLHPSVISTGRQTEGAKDAAHRKYLTCRRDGLEDSTLLRAVGKSRHPQREAGRAEDGDDEANRERLNAERQGQGRVGRCRSSGRAGEAGGRRCAASESLSSCSIMASPAASANRRSRWASVGKRATM